VDSANTGKVQTGGGNGGGGSVTTPAPKPDVTADVNNQPLPPDADFDALFSDSPEFDEFLEKFDKAHANDKDPEKTAKAYDRAYDAALARWISSKNIPAKPEEPPTGPPRPLDAFRRTPSIPTTLEEIQKDLQRANPHWDDPAFNIVAGPDKSNRQNHMHRVNCQRCVLAHEARRKGYEVTAVSVEDGWMPAPWSDDIMSHDLNKLSSTQQIASLFVKEDGSAPSWEPTSSVRRLPAVNDLERKILAWGEGGRGIIYAAWMDSYGGGAHVFSVEVKDGKILYLDPQSNNKDFGAGEDPNKNWKMRFSPSKALMALRVDNTDITQTGTTWMKGRTNDQVNLPTGAELTRHIDGKSGPEQILWGHLWQQLRAGEPPTLPQGGEYDSPEGRAIAREALLWLRRPD
jgi:hypothetical protein